MGEIGSEIVNSTLARAKNAQKAENIANDIRH
jgi:capsular polysaccharide biosynthesis protein